MKVFGLLSWFDESPTFLASCVASIAPHIDHLIAVDGAYANFPGSRAHSDRLQAETIQAICDGAGIACTIHRPAEPWRGNEVEKRDRMFKIAGAYSEPFVDWYWIIDADSIVTATPKDLRAQLEALEEWSVDVMLWEQHDYVGDVPEVSRTLMLPTIGEQSLTCLFRVLRDFQVVGTHYCYGGFRPDGEFVWAWAPHIMGAQDRRLIPEIRVEHRSIYRDKYRRGLAQTYYKIRDELGLERVTPRGAKGLEPIEVTQA